MNASSVVNGAPKSSSSVTDDTSAAAIEAPPESLPVGPQVVNAAIDAVAAYLPGRRDVIRAVMMAAITGEHSLMVGPPGTAKSMLARMVARVLGTKHYEHLMTRFTTPEEVLGPQKLTALAQDRFERNMVGYLPTAESAFLDETFKSNSAILNALLSVMSERQLTDGGKVHRLPLQTLMGASNEVPDPDDGLDAIFDRFLFRIEVPYLSDKKERLAMLTSTGAPANLPRIDLRGERVGVAQVCVTDDTLNALIALQDALADRGVRASDRRWKQCLNVLRASAYLDGRPDTDPESDLDSLAYVIGLPSQIATVREVIAKSVNPTGAKAAERAKAAKEILSILPPLSENADAAAARSVQDAIGRIAPDVKAIVSDLASMPPSRSVTMARKVVDEVLSDLRARAQAAAAILAGSI